MIKGKSVFCTTHEPITRFVNVKDVVTPYKTLETAAKEADEYEWMRAGDRFHICKHGDHIYPLITREIDGVLEIACGCKAWQFASGNDCCKHVAVFLKRSTPPQKPITAAIAKELMAAGWTGGKSNLRPPATTDPLPKTTNPVEMTSDEDGEDTGYDPVPDRSPKPTPPPEPGLITGTCQYCGLTIKRKLVGDLKQAIDDHEAICPKLPTDAKNATVEPEPEPEKPKMDNEIRQIIEEADALGAREIDPAYVDEKLATLRRFRVTGAEAIRSVVSGILRAQGIKRPKGTGGSRSNVLADIDTIDTEGRWINLRVKAVDIWHNEHESIRQVGLVGDETGTTKFVSWEKANLPVLEEGKCYSIENVVTKEYEGSYSVAFNKTTKITMIDDEIEVGFTTSEYSGILVAVQNGSGLIKRCSICNKAMQKSTCKEHGNVEGTHDLRIRAVLDNGTSTQNILLNRERTEELTCGTLDEAIKMAQDALDADVVAERMRSMLIGQEYAASGRDMGDTILVESMAGIDQPATKEMIAELIKEV